MKKPTSCTLFRIHVLDGALFRRVNAELHEEEKRLYARVRQMQHRIISSECVSYDTATVVSVLSDFDRLFPSLTLSRQKLIVHAVIDQIIVRERKVSAIEYNEPFKSLVSSLVESVAR